MPPGQNPRRYPAEEIMATKKRGFTALDMKKAFLAGERIGCGPLGWHRWMRVEFEQRYKRKRKAA